MAVWVAGMLACGAAGTAAAADESEPTLVDLDVRVSGRKVSVAMDLEGAFPSAIEDRLEDGLEVAFEYTVRLQRVRRRMPDATVSERYVVMTARYSTLTRMYRLTRRVDGAVIGRDLTDEVGAMHRWMTRIEPLELFDERDLRRSASYYVRAQARLLRRVRLLFLSGDVETDWVRSEDFRVQVPRR